MLLALMVGQIYKQREAYRLSGDNGIPEDWGCGVCVPPFLGCDPLDSKRERETVAKTHPQAFRAYTL